MTPASEHKVLFVLFFGGMGVGVGVGVEVWPVGHSEILEGYVN